MYYSLHVLERTKMDAVFEFSLVSAVLSTMVRRPNPVKLSQFTLSMLKAQI